MDKREFSGREILAGEAPQNAPVTIKGWVRTRRTVGDRPLPGHGEAALFP
jgi:hypothetical protein